MTINRRSYMAPCEGCISYTISDKTGRTISKFRSDREAIEFARGLVKLGTYGTLLVIDDQTDEIIAEITPTKGKGEA